MLIYIKSYHVNILIKKINEENKNVKKKKKKKNYLYGIAKTVATHY